MTPSSIDNELTVSILAPDDLIATNVIVNYQNVVDGCLDMNLNALNGFVANADTVIFQADFTANSVPVAKARAAKNVDTLSTLYLSGSFSSDANSDVLTYSWSIISAPIGSNATLTNATAVNPIFVPDIDGEYVFQLIVNDGIVSSTPDTVTVTANTIIEEINVFPVAKADVDTVSGKIITEGDTVIFDASSSIDSDGSISRYEWKEGSIVLSNALSFSISTLSTGNHTIILTVTDNDGATDSESIVISVASIESEFTSIAITDVVESSGTITHNGTKYDTIISLYTGRTWLDRNLGASRICTSFDDKECFGDYYQWGRDKDGHEKSNSLTTSTQASSVTNVGSNFITSVHWSTGDSDGNLRSWNWSKTDGSSVCPVGFRVPTIDEIKAEITLASTVVTSSIGECKANCVNPSLIQ